MRGEATAFELGSLSGFLRECAVWTELALEGTPVLEFDRFALAN